ncbi:MAG: copper amine oxidase N-terminal domain-containing protein [Clostridia bacterium]|nr:copper amine oxidase N-terminal domain-containing protein [Clostridia bacterium]
MKKLLSIILTCVLTLSTMVIPASADEIYYPCYVGTWTNTDSGNPIKLEIYSVSGNSMDFYFQYGQFAVNIYNASVSGTKVYGKYHEVWDDGVNWDNYVIDGTITLDLGDSCIWLYWHPYENGRDGGVRSYQMTNGGFQYKTVKSDTIKIVVNGQQLTPEQEPIIVNNRVMVPIRAISESLGADVSWEDVRKIGRVVGITKGSRYIGFCVDDTGYKIEYSPNYMMIRNGDSEGEFTALDAPVMIYNDYTLVPVRAVSEAFDANVSWDGDTKTVNISE